MNKSKRIEYTWAIIIALAGSLLLTYSECTQCRTDSLRYFQFASFSFLNWIMLWVVNSELNDFLSAHISWIKTPIKRLVIGVVGTIVFTVTAVLLIIKAFEWLAGFDFGDYKNVIVPSLIITTFISLFFHGRAFLLMWKQSAVDAERYQKESMQATYESLKSQVNPHFLFNSLNALTNLVYEDQDKAAKFIKQLSEVYRYVLDTRYKEVVPLQDELKFLESYAFLQQIRFGDKLLIAINITDLNFQIAPLALQMLMENAVKHNEVSAEKPLAITIYQSNDTLIVENTLQKRMKLGEESSGMGLENITKRYSFLTDKPVVVSKSEIAFSVSLPLIAV
jgi:Histidine kinase